MAVDNDTSALYRTELEKEPRLSQQETDLFASHFQAYKHLRQEVTGWLKERLGREPEFDEISLEIDSDLELAEIKQRGLDARNKLWVGHLRLVTTIAKRLFPKAQGTSFTYQDLVGEGNIGLEEGIERYEPGHGTFANYVGWRIEHNIRRAIDDQGRDPRIPVHLVEAYTKLTNRQIQRAQEEGSFLSFEELAPELGISPGFVRGIRSVPSVFSLSSPIGDTDRTIEEVVADPHQENAIETLLDRFIAEDKKEALKEAWEGLNQRWRDVLIWSLDLKNTGEQLSYSKIGQLLGVSHTMVGDIKRRALRRLREAIELD